MKNKFEEVVKRFVGILRKPEMQILPGQIAFYFLMSFIPIIALASLIASLINNNINLVELIINNIPKAFADVLITFIDSSSTGSNFIILLGCYLIMGSNGPKAIIIASDTLYGIKSYNPLKIKIKATIMTFIIIILLIFIIFIPILGDVIINFVINLFDNKTIFYRYSFVYSIAKFFVSFIIIYTTLKIIYTMAPNKKIKSRTTSIGALFTTTGWIIFSTIFSFYITNIAKYNALYGNFANVLILLLWLYFLAYLFVIGMALNVNFYQENIK